MKLDYVSKHMEEAGIHGRDTYDLPSSNKRFPDGASYRIEIAGVYGVRHLEALIDERHKRNIPVQFTILMLVMFFPQLALWLPNLVMG